MIFVRDKGRMCNNILQYGHLYAWGREHGRQTVSMRFSYKYQWFHICHTRYHNFRTYVVAKYAAKWHLLPVADFGLDAPASDYDAQEKRLLSHRHVVAEGWYARWYDLFLKYKSEIVALFQFDAAVSLCYNIGTTRFRKSTVAALIAADPSPRPELEQQWKQWRLAGGQVSQALVSRRNKEWELYKKINAAPLLLGVATVATLAVTSLMLIN